METLYVRLEGREDTEELILSREQSERARNDPQFLHTLLQNRFGGSSSQEDLSSKENLGCSWSHEDTLLLLEVYREKEGAFRTKRHGKVWEEIGEVISSKTGLEATGRQCQAKISGLKRTYKEVRARKAKSGNGSCHWRYLEVMDSIFGEKAWVDAPATAGSEGPPPKNLTTSPGTSKKRKVEGVLEELLGEWRNVREDMKEREEKRDEERSKRREEKEKKREEKKLEEQKRLELKEKKIELMKRRMLFEEQKLAIKAKKIAMKERKLEK